MFDRFSRPLHDRLGPRQSGQQQHAAPVRPVQPDRSDQSQQRLAQSHPLKQEYHIKKKDDAVRPMQVDSRNVIADDVVKVGVVSVVIKDVGKKPMDLVNRLNLILRSSCWPMIMRLAAAGQQTSTINLGGARRV